jgi:hypothetical protein
MYFDAEKSKKRGEESKFNLNRKDGTIKILDYSKSTINDLN